MVLWNREIQGFTQSFFTLQAKSWINHKNIWNRNTLSGEMASMMIQWCLPTEDNMVRLPFYYTQFQSCPCRAPHLDILPGYWLYHLCHHWRIENQRYHPRYYLIMARCWVQSSLKKVLTGYRESESGVAPPVVSPQAS